MLKAGIKMFLVSLYYIHNLAYDLISYFLLLIDLSDMLSNYLSSCYLHTCSSF